MSDDTYNFRYQRERDRFYSDIKKHREEVRENLGDEIHSALRVLFDIGEHTSQDRQKAQTGKFRGIRTFRDLRRLSRFLNSSDGGGSGIQWGRKDLRQYNITARLVYYTMRGNRVTGEKVLKTYYIQPE